MKTRICPKCKNELPETEDHFYWRNKKRGQLRNECKGCRKKSSNFNYHANREKYLKIAKRWAQANPAKCAIASNKWRDKNKNRVNERRRMLRIENIDRHRKAGRDREAAKRKTPKGNIDNRMSCALRHALRSKKNGQHWERVVGYTCKDLIKHLEKQFQAGMSWDNCGEWQIDHEIPISAFNYTESKHADFLRCWGLANLRPMWKHDNLSKYNKIEKHFQPSLLL